MNLLTVIVATATVSGSGWIDDLSSRVSGRVRAATGAEWDTNAYRAVDGQDAARIGGGDQQSDALFRVLVSAQGRLRLNDTHAISTRYLLGAKRFTREQSQDLTAHDLILRGSHRLAKRLALSTRARYRASRIRDETRNYDLGNGSIGLNWFLSETWQFVAEADFFAYRFFAQPRFDYVAPLGHLGVSFVPIRKLTFRLDGFYQYRHYFSTGLVSTTRADVTDPYATFCDPPQANEICTPTPRRDNEGQVRFGAAWRGSFVLGADYLLRLQRSTSDFENINRHRISLYATFAFPWETTASIVGALQFNDGVSVTDFSFLAEDDESQNSLNLKLSKFVTDKIAVDISYALYANQFSTADVQFIRQTIYLGVSFATGI